MSNDEITMLLEEARRGSLGVRSYAIICFLLDCGIRNSELRNLKVQNVSISGTPSLWST